MQREYRAAHDCQREQDDRELPWQRAERDHEDRRRSRVNERVWRVPGYDVVARLPHNVEVEEKAAVRVVLSRHPERMLVVRARQVFEDEHRRDQGRDNEEPNL